MIFWRRRTRIRWYRVLLIIFCRLCIGRLLSRTKWIIWRSLWRTISRRGRELHLRIRMFTKIYILGSEIWSWMPMAIMLTWMFLGSWPIGWSWSVITWWRILTMLLERRMKRILCGERPILCVLVVILNWWICMLNIMTWKRRPRNRVYLVTWVPVWRILIRVPPWL